MRCITQQSSAGCEAARHCSIFVWPEFLLQGGLASCRGVTGTRASAFPSPQHKIPDRGFCVPTAERESASAS